MLGVVIMPVLHYLARHGTIMGDMAGSVLPWVVVLVSGTVSALLLGRKS